MADLKTPLGRRELDALTLSTEAALMVSISVIYVRDFGNCVSGCAAFVNFTILKHQIHRRSLYFAGHPCIRRESESRAGSGSPTRRIVCRACGLTPVGRSDAS
jgi:hypothetical protein